MTTTRSNASATKRMSWLIAITVRPAAETDSTISRTAPRRLRPGPSSARRARAPASPSPGPMPAPAASVAPRRGRTGSSPSSPSRPVARSARATAVFRALSRVRGSSTELDLASDGAGEDLAVRVLEHEPDLRRQLARPSGPRRRSRRAAPCRRSAAAGRSSGARASSCRCRSGRRAPRARQARCAGRHRREPAPPPRRRRGRGRRCARSTIGERRRDSRPIEPASAIARPSRTGDGSATPSAVSLMSPSTDAADPLSAIRPPSSTTTREATAASRSVFCSVTRIEAPSAASRSIASATSRVPAGSSWAVGSSRTRCAGRIASSPAIATSCCCPPDSRRGSRSARPSIRIAARASHVRATTSSRGSARFIGPKATSSKTLSATCDSCVTGFWKPIAMRWLSRCIGQSSTASPSTVMLPRIRPPIVRGARPLATRQSVVLPDSDRPATPSTSPSRARGRCRAAPAASRRRSDSRRRPGGCSRQPAGDGGDDEEGQPGDERPARDRLRTESGGAHSSVRRPGRPKPRASSAIARSSTSAIEPRITGPTIGTIPRMRRQTEPSVSSPRARCAAVIWRALHHGRHRLDRCVGDEPDARADSAALEVNDEVRRPRRQVEERDRAADGQDPRQDLEGEGKTLGGGGDRTDAEEHRRAAGEEEDVDQQCRERDRQRQQQRQTRQLTERRRRRWPGR